MSRRRGQHSPSRRSARFQKLSELKVTSITIGGGPNLLAPQEVASRPLKEGDKNWNNKCMNCDSLPTVHPTDLCGPCCFGEADTIDGNW